MLEQGLEKVEEPEGLVLEQLLERVKELGLVPGVLLKGFAPVGLVPAIAC